MTERREYTRFRPLKPTEVTFTDCSGADGTAVVLNESSGGASLLSTESCVMIPGGTVSVVYHGTPVRGIVWHSRREPEGIVFGVEWLD
jgi:hypothetical protein